MPAHRIPWEGMQLPQHAAKILSKTDSSTSVRSSDKKLAVIIPFRDREAHLKKLLPALHALLPHVTASYEIIIAEQSDNQLFNKGALCNAAVASLEGAFDYVCFHDVDFFPENVDYRYSDVPFRPFSQTRGKKVYQEEFHEGRLERLLNFDPTLEEKTERLASVYPHFWGGVFFLPLEAFKKVNGFSNQFPYWGFEDLDFLLRLLARGEVPHMDSGGVFQLQYHPHVIQKNDPHIKELILNNLDRYRKESKEFRFQGGLSTLCYIAGDVVKNINERRMLFCSMVDKSI